MNNPKVIILIIVHKESLEPYERISLTQCFRILGHYPIKFICPEGLNVRAYLDINPASSFDFIPPHWQSNYGNFARLKMLPFLYKRYSDYEYVLFYEADAFVFRDDLMEWCRKGYDCIGAPWLEGWSEATPGAPFIGVGNGGFSLRKIESLLKVNHSFSYIYWPSELWKRFQAVPLMDKSRAFWDLIKNLTVRNNTFHWFNDRAKTEDVFWGMFVKRNFKWFNVPDAEEASRFSFEAQPRHLYAMNGQQLPFGCHAWWRYDLEFWRPFIREFGYDI